MRVSNKGFFLIDALLSVFIVSCICILCFTIFNIINKYEEGYINYQIKSNYYYENLFNNLKECEACNIDESD